ncbi:hypothetical protein [Wolbachia pipientis]|uniref:hypothetical protein n=1 Tax=Wolbachia pipientis TaxID=955 RepID=UPI00202DFE41|nr:hypothetical protein [Wolbachia pipientis]MCM1002538.1 hypothetical protein [Wolbachia pipientis]
MDKSTRGIILIVGLGAVLGGLTGLGLSFTALSPLVIGGIVAAVPAILFVALGVYYSVRKGEFRKEDLFAAACICVAGAAIGVGLAAAATAIFPVQCLEQDLHLTGAVIGAIAPIAGILAAEYIIAPIAEKVNEYVLSLMIEKVKGCFSSKEKEV